MFFYFNLYEMYTSVNWRFILPSKPCKLAARGYIPYYILIIATDA